MRVICLLILMLAFSKNLFAQNYELKKEIKSFYETGVEKDRLCKKRGILENLRVKDLLDRNISKKKSVILDVGGGMGVHAFYLSKKGHKVYLIDPVEYNINEAKKIAKTQNYSLKDFIVADARKLPFKDDSIDVVLLFGPLYHLDKKDRHIALKEAYRVLKPGGQLFAQGISKYTLLLNYYCNGKIANIENQKMVSKNLKSDRFLYKNGVFYTHSPKMLKQEFKKANFSNIKILSVEGFGSWFDKRYYEDKHFQKILLKFLQETEKEPSLISMSPHIMIIANKD